MFAESRFSDARACAYFSGKDLERSRCILLNVFVWQFYYRRVPRELESIDLIYREYSISEYLLRSISAEDQFPLDKSSRSHIGKTGLGHVCASIVFFFET
jgi:hypothetical protein